MPTYTFRDIETFEIFDKSMKIDEKQTYLNENPNIESIITSSPSLGDSVRLGLRKPDSGFQEVLSKIASNNYKSNLTDKLSRK